MVEGVFPSSTQVKVSLPHYENSPLKALHSKREKKSTLKSHRSDCFHLTYDYIVHTLLWCWGISIYFAECCRHTINLPPPFTPPPSLFILSCCAACWGEVRTRQGGKHLGKGSPKPRERVVGCGLPSAPGGIWGKWPETKLQRWQQRHGAKCSWTLPYSRAQQHSTQHTSPVFPEESHPVIQLYKSWP